MQSAVRIAERQLGLRPNTIALDLTEELPDTTSTAFGDNVISASPA